MHVDKNFVGFEVDLGLFVVDSLSAAPFCWIRGIDLGLNLQQTDEDLPRIQQNGATDSE